MLDRRPIGKGSFMFWLFVYVFCLHTLSLFAFSVIYVIHQLKENKKKGSIRVLLRSSGSESFGII